MKNRTIFIFADHSPNCHGPITEKTLAAGVPAAKIATKAPTKNDEAFTVTLRTANGHCRSHLGTIGEASEY
jgi:hypothetical protein